eukprot:10961770-Alexandrium_andersonii.AAC.1
MSTGTPTWLGSTRDLRKSEAGMPTGPSLLNSMCLTKVAVRSKRPVGLQLPNPGMSPHRLWCSGIHTEQ